MPQENSQPEIIDSVHVDADINGHRITTDFNGKSGAIAKAGSGHHPIRLTVERDATTGQTTKVVYEAFTPEASLDVSMISQMMEKVCRVGRGGEYDWAIGLFFVLALFVFLVVVFIRPGRSCDVFNSSQKTERPGSAQVSGS